MSLINKALKKAQNQYGDPASQSPSTSSSPGGHSMPPRHGPAASPVPWFPIMLALIALVFVLAVVLVAVLFLLLNSQGNSVAQEDTPAAAAVVDRIAPAPHVARTAEVTESAPQGSETVASEVASESAEAPLPAVPESIVEPNGSTVVESAPEPESLPEPDPAPESAVEPPVLPPVAEVSSEAAGQIETLGADNHRPDPRIIEWLAESTINGVRLAGQNSRLSMNNRHYRIGDSVHFELGLRLRAIQEERVLFEDERGVRYVKRY